MTITSIHDYPNSFFLAFLGAIPQGRGQIIRFGRHVTRAPSKEVFGRIWKSGPFDLSSEGMKSRLARGAGNISPSRKLLSILCKTYIYI